MSKKLNNNKIVRKALTETGVRNWEFADILGVSPETISRRLRHEMPETDQIKYAEMIRDYAMRNYRRGRV